MNTYAGICYEGTLTRTRIREPLYLGDKPIMATLEVPDEDYGPNYTRALGFAKMESYFTIYAFMNPMPQKERLLTTFI